MALSEKRPQDLRRSLPDRRSSPDRRSPCERFFPSDRVSLPERRSRPDRRFDFRTLRIVASTPLNYRFLLQYQKHRLDLILFAVSVRH